MLSVKTVNTFIVRRSTLSYANKYAFVLGCKNFSCTSAVNSKKKRNIHNNNFMQKFDQCMLKILDRWPFLRDYYHQMTTGFKSQSSDFKTWWRVGYKEESGFKTTYREHKAIFDIKASLLRSSILLPIFMLPMGILLVFIPVVLAPQYMLPPCYWNPAQRRKFLSQWHKSRSYHNAIIFHHLKYLQNNHSSHAFRRTLEPVLSKVNSGDALQNKDLMRLKDWSMTMENPLQLSEMPPLLLSKFSQVNHLWYMFPPSWNTFYLQRRVKLILEFDEKLRKEDLVSDLSEKELQEANFLRGLDSANLTLKANQYWLNNWIEHTSTCSTLEVSYLLHAMVLQTHNFSELKYQRRVFDR